MFAQPHGAGFGMKHIFSITLGILLLAGNSHVHGQAATPGGLPSGVYHALLDILGEGPSFYGRATIQLADGPDKAPLPITCNIALFGRSMRVETDSLNPGPNVPPLEAARLQSMHAINILRPDRNRSYLVFPSFHAYVEIAYANAGSNPALPAKIDKTQIGPENVGDQPCLKSHWAVSESGGQQFDVTVWTSKNWNDFPIQIKIASPAVTVVFDNLHLDAPDGSLFDPPADYTKYEGIQEIIRRNAEKAQNGAQQ